MRYKKDVQRELSEEKKVAVVETLNLLLSALKRSMKSQAVTGEIRVLQRPGPKPVTCIDIKNDLVKWALAMQKVNISVQHQ
ncbi:hypothetical protein GN958_ATG01738 [Phytophthora infestans]|uniref:Uncharacterized protein n=1 Tax=Phytophthora infestans TaxID=4787 RepID=A0A8S9VC46_PHYIN|nr:hypothetical protein GN958_ATG01738 [Phytophthora infestans]